MCLPFPKFCSQLQLRNLGGNTTGTGKEMGRGMGRAAGFGTGKLIPRSGALHRSRELLLPKDRRQRPQAPSLPREKKNPTSYSTEREREKPPNGAFSSTAPLPRLFSRRCFGLLSAQFLGSWSSWKVRSDGIRVSDCSSFQGIQGKTKGSSAWLPPAPLAAQRLPTPGMQLQSRSHSLGSLAKAERNQHFLKSTLSQTFPG